MKTVYCISGLGADERVFGNLMLSGVQTRMIQWIQPLPGEPIGAYATRLAYQITDEDPVLMGLSFGGMMAIEIARLRPVQKIILISSIKNAAELPTWMKRCGQLHLDRILPDRQLSSIKAFRALRPIQNYFLGAKTPEEKRIANQYRDTVDPLYLKWALNHVLNWKNAHVPNNLYHIHGDQDHIFPLKKIHPTHIIPGGGHFMIMDKAAAVSAILNELL